MSNRLSSIQSKRLESSLSLMNYVVHVQRHMTDYQLKQELNYQSQAELELFVSRQEFL
ncbi:MAG: hypothetical protein WBF90_10730 [Rivularia sp. (in: cyanobacteria)]